MANGADVRWFVCVGFFGVGRARQPDFRESKLVVVYCFCRCQFIAKRIHKVVLAGNDFAQAGRARRLLKPDYSVVRNINMPNRTVGIIRLSRLVLGLALV